MEAWGEEVSGRRVAVTAARPGGRSGASVEIQKTATQKIEARLEQVGRPVAAGGVAANHHSADAGSGGGVDFHMVPGPVRQAVAERSIVPAAQPGGWKRGVSVENPETATQKIEARLEQVRAPILARAALAPAQRHVARMQLDERRLNRMGARVVGPGARGGGRSEVRGANGAGAGGTGATTTVPTATIARPSLEPLRARGRRAPGRRTPGRERARIPSACRAGGGDPGARWPSAARAFG